MEVQRTFIHTSDHLMLMHGGYADLMTGNDVWRICMEAGYLQPTNKGAGCRTKRLHALEPSKPAGKPYI